MADFIFVDRRPTGRGKSLPNREKLLRRIKDSIRQANQVNIEDATNVRGGTVNKQTAGAVRVTREALSEPTFHYDPRSGERDVVLPGNDRWERGDEFPMSSDEADGDGQPEPGDGDDGEDDFIVNVSREEFLNVFFEDCELPDLEQTAEKELPEAVRKPAGFQKEGNPGQLSVIRSYRQSFGRRRAIHGSSYAEIEALEKEVQQLHDRTHPQCDYLTEEELGSILFGLIERIAALRAKISATPAFEKVDLRYRKTDKVMVKQAQATLCMVMDVSGSMDEELKRLARRFFSLQYAFITRKYPHTDLLFIIHTTQAEEVDEETFFTSRKNGGTMISPSLELANNILKQRYDPTQTNLYLSYAGDGDNWHTDNELVVKELVDENLLARLRHAVYIQVGDEMANWGGNLSGQARLWGQLKSVANNNRKLHLIKIRNQDEVFSAFKQIYAVKNSITGK